MNQSFLKIMEISPDRQFGRFGINIFDDIYKKMFLGFQRTTGFGCLWVKAVRNQI